MTAEPSQPSAAPLSEDHARLRPLFERQQLEAVIAAVEGELPGLPGSATRRNNVSGLRTFLRWAFEERRSVLNPASVLAGEYLAFLRSRHPDTPATVINKLSHVRNLYIGLLRLGLAESNPFDGLTQPSNDPTEHKELYSEAELNRLDAHASTEDRALVLLGGLGGLTGREAAALRWEEIDVTGGQLRVRGRVVEAPDELRRALEAHALTQGITALFGGSGPVFAEIAGDHAARGRLYALCRSANVPYRAWRALRNTAGLRLLRLTGDEARVADQLGLGTLKAVQVLARRGRKDS